MISLSIFLPKPFHWLPHFSQNHVIHILMSSKIKLLISSGYGKIWISIMFAKNCLWYLHFFQNHAFQKQMISLYLSPTQKQIIVIQLFEQSDFLCPIILMLHLFYISTKLFSSTMEHLGKHWTLLSYFLAFSFGLVNTNMRKSSCMPFHYILCQTIQSPSFVLSCSPTCFLPKPAKTNKH